VTMSKAAFLDRDGIINRKAPEGNYITRWEDFYILPGVPEGIALLKRAAFSVIVVTNQRCIAKNLLAVDELEAIHQKMSAALSRAGAALDGIYYCPHDSEPPCRCRKPAPGMLLDAARDHGIDLPSSWMIGDSVIDVEAGRNAGCKTARLLSAGEAFDEGEGGRGVSRSADIVAQSLLDAARQILRLEETAASSFRTAPAAT